MRIAVFHNLPSGGAKRALYGCVKYLTTVGHVVHVYVPNTADERFLPLKDFAQRLEVFPAKTTRTRSRISVKLHRAFSLVHCDLYDLEETQKEIAWAINKSENEVVLVEQDQFTMSPFLLKYIEKPTVYYCPQPVYVWPTNGQRAYVSYLPSNTYPSEINLKKLARFVVKMGGARYSFLPSVYYSAVAKCILDMIRKQTGRVFHSTQPDVFTALAVPVFSDTAINVGYTVTVGGQSPKSNSAVTYGRDGIVNIEKFVQEYGDYKIHPSLFPGINVRANLLADSMLIAMDKFPQFYNGLQFNYNAMWAYTLRLARFFKWDISIKEILQKRRQIRYYHSFSVLQFLKYCILQESAAFYRSFLKKNMKLGPFSKSVPDNISEFVKQLADYQKTL